MTESLLAAIAPPDHETEGWRITGINSADWAARKAAASRNKINEAETAAKEQIQQVQAWAEAERQKHQNDAEYFESHLHQYLIEQRRHEATSGTSDDKLTKTIKLPGGTQIKARQSPDKFVVLDEAATLTWAQTSGNDQLIRTKKSVALAEVRKFVKDSGELPDGVNFEPGEIRFTVTHE